jgi:hypothetical protein
LRNFSANCADEVVEVTIQPGEAAYGKKENTDEETGLYA